MLIAGSPVPLARSSTCIPSDGCAYSTSASVTGCPIAADFAFHFSEATRRYWFPQSGLESGREVIGLQDREKNYEAFFTFIFFFFAETSLGSIFRFLGIAFRSDGSSRFADFHSRSRS